MMKLLNKNLKMSNFNNNNKKKKNKKKKTMIKANNQMKIKIKK